MHSENEREMVGKLKKKIRLKNFFQICFFLKILHLDVEVREQGSLSGSVRRHCTLKSY